MKIFKFRQFESYLEGGRQPLYHYTSYLKEILESDKLKIHEAANGETSISFTRSLIFTEHVSYVRLVLDADKLKRDGYKIIPTDEVMAKAVKKPTLLKTRFKDYSKVNFKTPYRKTIHKLDIKDWEDEDGMDGLEWEYEERCYKDIKNLGKYLIAIDITEDKFKQNKNEIEEYLKKYPSIKIMELNPKKLWDRRKEISL